MAYKRLGDLLIAAGTITPEELDMGLQRQKETKERLGAALISAGIITEAELIEALRLQLGIEYIDLSKTTIPISLAQVVPKNIAKQFQVVPVRMERDELYLAMSDPMNFYAIEEVKKAVRKKIVPMIATTEGVEHAILVLYGNEGAARAIEAMKREAPIEEDNGEEAQFTGNILNDNINDAPTIRLVNSIIERAILERASDIHIEPKEKELQVRMRIDGVLRKILTIPKNLQNSVISRLKIMSGMDIAERRVPQDGRFNVKNKKREFDLRVNSLPTVYGEKIVARLLDKRAGYLTPDLCVINQREVGKDTASFSEGLRASLREDPDVILIGEMRDKDTIETAITAAETGHLVFGTLHTGSASDAIDRMVQVFPEGMQNQIRLQLSMTLMAVISQQLVKKKTGGRVLASEVMVVTDGIRNMIRGGNTPQIANAIATSAAIGGQTMDQSLVSLVRSRQIDKAVAVEYSHDQAYVKKNA